jgi:hypothetical protein
MPKEYRDRIEKGAEIARLGHVREHKSGGYAVQSESNSVQSYHVQRDRSSCNCPGYLKNMGICKRLWSTAPALALTILEMREAETVDDLDRLFDEGRESARDLPRGFELSMRHDYARNFARVEDEVDLAKAAARINTRDRITASQADLAARM